MRRRMPSGFCVGYPVFSRPLVETIVCRTSETGARSDSRLRAETAVASIEGIVLSALAQPAERRGPYIDKTLRMVLLGTASPEDARPTH